MVITPKHVGAMLIIVQQDATVYSLLYFVPTSPRQLKVEETV